MCGLLMLRFQSESNKYLAVQGDVWGIAGNVNFRGFMPGDRFKWTLKTLPELLWT
jgi:hypothetical protein